MINIESLGNNRFLIKWKFQDIIVESLYEGELNNKTVNRIMSWIIDNYVSDLLLDNPENRDILEREKELCKLEINHSLLENC